MTWENRAPPEGINYSRDNPLKELAILLFAALLIVVAGVAALSFAAGWLAQQVPFAQERAWAAPLAERFAAQRGDVDAREVAATRRLQAMADRVARLQGMPAGMTLTVHIADEDMVNAFATLGGHLVFTRGLLAVLPHENALVTVLAHEAAHVKHRDPLVALGRGVTVATALGVLTGVGDGGLASGQLQGAGLMTALHFGRDQERAADAEALRTLTAWYGHTAGAADLFTALSGARGGAEPPPLFSTHPATDERLAAMRAATTPGDLLPLPAEILELVKSAPRPAAGGPQ